MNQFAFSLRIIVFVGAFSLFNLSNGRAAFVVAGYSQDTPTAFKYDIFGAGLSSVTSLTLSSYSSQGDTAAALAFTPISDTELQFSVSQSLSNYVALRFSSASYTDIEVTYSTTASPGLQTVQTGQNVTGTSCAGQVLVESGGTFNGGGAGVTSVFVETGGTYTGTGGGGSNSIYYATGANVSQNSGGGGGNVFQAVDSIKRLQAIPEPGSCLLLISGLAAFAMFGQSQRAEHRDI